MRIRFYNARILTLANDLSIIENGELVTEDGRISYVGKMRDDGAAGFQTSRKADKPFDREIDSKGNLLMPGFKNCHTHSAMTFLRSNADDMKLQDWLTKQVFPYEAKLTADDVYYCTCLAALEYLTSGITSVCEMYFHGDEIARAFKDIGIRAVIGGVLSDGNQDLESQLNWYERYNEENSLISFRFGAHAEYTNSRSNLEKLSKVLHEKKSPVYLHISETESEVGECIKRYGKTPPQFFDSLGLFDYGGAVFHGVHVTDDDIEVFRKKQVSVITNPASNLKLASGIAPINKYLEAGVNLGIGTDGPASNNSLDMFKEMFLVTALAKIREMDASVVPADEVLLMATKKGAHAIGHSACDCLAPGKNADLVMLDLSAPNMRPLNNIVKAIVYSGSKANVLLTMVNGRILYENGKFNIGLDREEIYSKAEKVLPRMKREMEESK